MERGEVTKGQPVQVRDTGKTGKAAMIGERGLVYVVFDEPYPIGRTVYDPEELDPLETDKQETEG